MDRRPSQSQPALRQQPRRVMDMHPSGVVPKGLQPSLNIQGATKRQRHFSLKLFSVVCGCILLCASFGFVGWRILANRQTPLHTAKQVQVTANAYQIINDPAGVKFSISKDFQALNSTDLKHMNPFFTYGYRMPNVANVRCIISQTARTEHAPISADDLGKGTLSQLKTSYPDVTAIGYQAIALKNKRSAAELIVNYHESGTLIRQAEVVAATDAQTTFAFCTSPDPLYSYYLPKFTQFFTSLEVY